MHQLKIRSGLRHTKGIKFLKILHPAGEAAIIAEEKDDLQCLGNGSMQDSSLWECNRMQ